MENSNTYSVEFKTSSIDDSLNKKKKHFHLIHSCFNRIYNKWLQLTVSLFN